MPGPTPSNFEPTPNPTTEIASLQLEDSVGMLKKEIDAEEKENDIKLNLNFEEIPKEKLDEIVSIYKLPIDAIDTEYGEMIVRAVSVEEVPDLYKESLVDGKLNEELLQSNQLKKCILWPTQYLQTIEDNQDRVPGGFLQDITETIEKLSGMKPYKHITISKYIEALEADEKGDTQVLMDLLPEGKLSNRHPTLEEAKKYAEWEEKGMSVMVLQVDITDTDYIYRGFSIPEMSKFDKDLMDKGGLNQQSLVLSDVQTYILSKLCMYPLDVTERLEGTFSFPGWLPAVIAEGIFVASGAISREKRSISKG